MWKYIIYAVFFAGMWVANPRWLAQATRERSIAEIYEHTGLVIFFTSLTLEPTLGLAGESACQTTRS